MNYANIRRVDVANGPGVRVSLFVSGCPHHCAGCFNPETWDFAFGSAFGAEQEEEILRSLRPAHIRGLSLLGGEPFAPENQQTVFELVEKVRRELPEKDIWCYTGYLFEQLRDGLIGDNSQSLLKKLDVLVDGPFVLERKNLGLRFRGSDNQRIILVKDSLISGQVCLWKEN